MNVRLMVSLLTVTTLGYSATTSFERDRTMERALRWEASADKTITPQKVMRHLFSHNQGPEPRTEFQPILNVYNGQVRAVAAIAYKF